MYADMPMRRSGAYKLNERFLLLFSFFRAERGKTKTNDREEHDP
jgi:hypothetical protein